MRSVGHLGGAGQHVVGERGGERLAVRVERHFLVERGADALRAAADHLAVDDHRVEQHAAILDDHVVEDAQRRRVSVSTETTTACAA